MSASILSGDMKGKPFRSWGLQVLGLRVLWMQEIRCHELADGSKSYKYPEPFPGAEGIPRPLAHLCHIPFLALQPSLRRTLAVCQCLLHEWKGASQPWASASRQARAWQEGGGKPGAVVYEKRLQSTAESM
jgi:hypothetical protein